MTNLKIKHVYFIYDDENNIVKIGTSFNPTARMKSIQTGPSADHKFKLLYVFTGGGKRKEKEFHIRFDRYHIGREWFEYSDEIEQFINVMQKNHLVWVGQDVETIPKNIKPIGFLTDIKTFRRIEQMAEISGRSVHGMTNFCMRIMTQYEKKNRAAILSLNDYAFFYHMKCNYLQKKVKRLERNIEKIKKLKRKGIISYLYFKYIK